MAYKLGQTNLVAPQTFEELSLDGSVLRAGKNVFPVTGQIPWLAPQADSVMKNWRERLFMALKYTVGQTYYFNMWSQNAGLPQSAQSRLRALADGEAGRAALLQKVCDHLGWDPEEASTGNSSSKERLRQEATSINQGVLSYFDHLARDWSWGQVEISAQLQLFEKILPAGFTGAGQALIVVGSGAGRLCYELRKRNLFAEIVAFDINPVLTTMGQLLTTGHQVRIPEFPVAPRSADSPTVQHTCRMQESVSGVHFAIADAYALPLASESVEWILTPFVIDILPKHMEFLATEINRVLKPKGKWINIGTVGFTKGDPRQQILKDEVRELLRFHDFQALSEMEQAMPFLSSPYSRQTRTEIIDAWTVEKIGPPSPVREHVVNIDQGIEPASANMDLDQPISLTGDIQMRLMQTEIRLWLLNQIDGKTSVAQIVKRMTEKFGLHPRDAQEAIVSFLTQPS